MADAFPEASEPAFIAQDLVGPLVLVSESDIGWFNDIVSDEVDPSYAAIGFTDHRLLAAALAALREHGFPQRVLPYS